MPKQLAQARVDTPLVPNEVTIEAMREARRDDLPRFASVEDLLDDLHADHSAASRTDGDPRPSHRSVRSPSSS